MKRSFLRPCAPFILGIASLINFPNPSQAQEVKADPHRFDQAIAAFEAADEKKMPDPGKVLFLGSSSIRRWDTANAFKGIDSINRGFGGSQISDSIFFFDRIVAPYQPSVIAFYAGDNDIGAGKSIDKVFGDFETFAQMTRERLPGTKIVYIAIKPSIRRKALWSKMDVVNKRIQALSKSDADLYYADIATPMLATGFPPDMSLFAKDGLHLSAEGNEMWRDVIRPVIETALADR